MMKKVSTRLFLLIAIAVTVFSCKKGYVAPAHFPPQQITNVAKITNLMDNEYPTLSVNGLQINTAYFQGYPSGMYPRYSYPLSVVNGQSFQVTLNLAGQTLADTSLTADNDGLDAYYIYQAKTDSPKYHIATLHTPLSTTSGGGNIKIRFVNMLPQLPGAGTIKIQLSRKHNYPVNNNLGLPFGMATPYIEVPYGVYQPLLLDENNNPILNYYVDPSSTIGLNPMSWPQIDLQPGGVYTFVVSKIYDQAHLFQALTATQLTQDNLFSQTPYGKVFFIHAAPSLNDVFVKIDSKLPYQSPLSYGNDQNTITLSAGDHNVQITDHAGNVIIDRSISILNKVRQAIFLVTNKAGQPDLEFFNLPQIGSSDLVGNYFNFSPDSPPVTFLSEAFSSNGVTLFIPGTNTPFGAGNLPFLQMPALTGLDNEPQVPGQNLRDFIYLPFDNIYFGQITAPPKIKIAFVGAGTAVMPSNVVPNTSLNNAFLEYPSFARYFVKASSKTLLYDGDSGYYLIAVIGLRYPTDASRALQIKSFKYVE